MSWLNDQKKKIKEKEDQHKLFLKQQKDEEKLKKDRFKYIIDKIYNKIHKDLNGKNTDFGKIVVKKQDSSLEILAGKEILVRIWIYTDYVNRFDKEEEETYIGMNLYKSYKNKERYTHHYTNYSEEYLDEDLAEYLLCFIK